MLSVDQKSKESYSRPCPEMNSASISESAQRDPEPILNQVQDKAQDDKKNKTKTSLSC
jgi:hypothetical protein